jgi:hypothetical protein
LICREENGLLVEKSRNFDEISQILFNSEIWDYITPGDEIKDIQRYNKKEAHYYLFKINNEIVGISPILCITPVIHSVDIGFLPAFRGKIAFRFAKIAVELHDEIFNRPILLSKIRLYHRKSLFYALRNGFRILFKDDEYYHIERL